MTIERPPSRVNRVVSERYDESGDPYESRIAEAEARLAALTEHIAAVESERAAIAAALASARRAAPRSVFLGERAALVLTSGAFRLVFGGPHGTRVERGTNRDGPAGERRAVTTPAPEVAPTAALLDAEAAVWRVLETNAPIVRIDCGPGGGATTLVRRLAAGARDHGFADGALLLTDVRGPVADIGQRLARLIRVAEPPRYLSMPELQREFAAVAALVALDRARLAADEQAELAALFPSLRFVIVDGLALPSTPTVALDSVGAERALALLESGYGRRIDASERAAARELCATVAAWPGRARLVGIAAAELRRPFESLRMQFVSGSAVIKAFIARLPATEGRILATLARARTPLSGALVAGILGKDGLDAAFERLTDCELVRLTEHATYELPRAVRPLLPGVADADAHQDKIIEVLRAALDTRAEPPVSDEQLAAAESLVQFAHERSHLAYVLALGPPLAVQLAARGQFGAWGRVLELVASAAETGDDAVALSLAQHELGVRALLLGKRDEAAALLSLALRERNRGGDPDSAAVSGNVLALLGGAPVKPPNFPGARLETGNVAPRRPPEPKLVFPAESGADPPIDRGSPASPARPAAPSGRAAAQAVLGTIRHAAAAVSARLRSLRLPAVSRRGWALAGGAVVAAVAALFAVVLWPRPAAGPALVEFSSDAEMIATGASALLCVQAQSASLVEIEPQVGLVPSEGRHCIAVHPLLTTVYTAVATGADGHEARSTVTVGVRSTPAPRPLAIDSFFADPVRIAAGGSTRLCYAVTGADLLRIVPRVGNLVRLHACRTVTLTDPHPYTYRLLAIGESGQVAVRTARIEVVSPSPSPSSAPSPSAAPSTAPAAARTVLATTASATASETRPPGELLARRAVYQFDATPSVVDRGQTASLCVGVDHWAHGEVTAIGALTPGITRCFRVRPAVTTVYRLHVTIDKSTAVETVTVAVRTPARAPVVAHASHR